MNQLEPVNQTKNPPPYSQVTTVDWAKVIERRPYLLELLQKKDFSYLVYPEIQQLIAATEYLDDKLMVELLWRTGARISEMLLVTVGDIYFEDSDTACIALKTLKRRKRGNTARQQHDIRIIELSGSEPVHLIKLYIKERGLKKSDPLFRGVRSTWWRKLKAIADRADLPCEFYLHTLRHSFAVNLLFHGLALGQIQKLLGHKRPETTEIYLAVLGGDFSQFTGNVKF